MGVQLLFLFFIFYSVQGVWGVAVEGGGYRGGGPYKKMGVKKNKKNTQCKG